MAIKRTCLILSLTPILLAFQNCGSAAQRSSTTEFSDTVSNNMPTEKVVLDSTASFTKLVYDSRLEFADPATSNTRLELNTTNGQLNLDQTSTCDLDANRLKQLRDLLASSSVCEPGPLPQGTVSCMAIGLADIELSNNASDEVRLRGVICNSGTFLCNGQDAVLRALLLDIKTNPPPGC